MNQLHIERRADECEREERSPCIRVAGCTFVLVV